jgi:N-acetyl-gamma-glutamylphosphate reductase
MRADLNKQLHALLTQTGLMHAKQLLVESYSSGRETSSTGLKDHEAIEMIKYLKSELKKQQAKNTDPQHIGNVMPTIKQNTPAQQANTMRKKIIALAHQMGWSAVHPTSGNKIADMARINAWCEKYGYLHKELNAYTLEELPKLVTQFVNLYNSFLKGF